MSRNYISYLIISHSPFTVQNAYQQFKIQLYHSESKKITKISCKDLVNESCNNICWHAYIARHVCIHTVGKPYSILVTFMVTLRLLTQNWYVETFENKATSKD